MAVDCTNETPRIGVLLVLVAAAFASSIHRNKNQAEWEVCRRNYAQKTVAVSGKLLEGLGGGFVVVVVFGLLSNLSPYSLHFWSAISAMCFRCAVIGCTSCSKLCSNLGFSVTSFNYLLLFL